MSITNADLNAGSHVAPRLTTWETVQKYVLIPVMVSSFLISLTKDLCCLRITNLKSLKRAVARTIAQSSKRLTPRQLLASRNPTGVTITDVCKAQNLPHRVVELDVPGFHPARLHLITLPQDGKSHHDNDNDNDTKTSTHDTTPLSDGVLLYFHGGGYIAPMLSAHVHFARLAAHAARTPSLALLEYTLAPAAPYPTQLAQAVAALRHLLLAHPPAQIVLAGDSAGGNLTLALLAHLAHPHPDIIPPLDLPPGEKLRAAVCVSPRCANDASARSFRNAGRDIIWPVDVRLFTENWRPAVDEVYATPLRGDRGFWRRVPVRCVLVLVGTDECYLDDVRAFAKVLGAEEGSGDGRGGEEEREGERVLVVCPGEYHVMCVIDVALGVRDGIMLTSVLRWLEGL